MNDGVRLVLDLLDLADEVRQSLGLREHRSEHVCRDFHLCGKLIEESEEAFVAGDERHDIRFGGRTVGASQSGLCNVHRQN